MDLPTVKDSEIDSLSSKWKSIWPFVQQLTVRDEAHCCLIPLCTSIRSLIVCDVIHVGQREIDMFPTRLEELFLDGFGFNTEDFYNPDVDSDCEFDYVDGGEYYFESELESSAVNRYFKKLRGVQKLIAEGVSVPHKFYKQNKDTLTSISWSVDDGELPCVFPHLTEVTLLASHLTAEESMKKVLKDVGGQLLKLNLVNLNTTDHFKVTDRNFPRLEDLTISSCNEIGLKLVGRSGTLQRLKIMKPSKFVINNVDHLRTVIKNLPALKDLYIEDFDATLEFERQLVDYLRGEGREMRLNGVILK